MRALVIVEAFFLPYPTQVVGDGPMQRGLAAEGEQGRRHGARDDCVAERARAQGVRPLDVRDEMGQRGQTRTGEDTIL